MNFWGTKISYVRKCFRKTDGIQQSFGFIHRPQTNYKTRLMRVSFESSFFIKLKTWFFFLIFFRSFFWFCFLIESITKSRISNAIRLKNIFFSNGSVKHAFQTKAYLYNVHCTPVCTVYTVHTFDSVRTQYSVLNVQYSVFSVSK